MLNRIKATPDQITKITTKYVRNIKTPIECTYDDEDGIYFFSAENIGPERNCWLQFQVRMGRGIDDSQEAILVDVAEGAICYCSLRKGQTSYDIDSGNDDRQKCLFPQLKRIAELSLRDWAAGNQI